MKKCYKCNKTQGLSEFTKCSGNARKLSYSCKSCDKEDRERRRNTNIRSHFVDVVRTSKQRYKKRKIIGKYELTPDFLEELFIKQKGVCALSGITMTHISGKGQVSTNVSLDRIDNEKGYTEDNIQLVCRCINNFKMSMTNDQTKILLGKINPAVVDIKLSKEAQEALQEVKEELTHIDEDFELIDSKIVAELVTALEARQDKPEGEEEGGNEACKECGGVVDLDNCTYLRDDKTHKIASYICYKCDDRPL